MKRLELLNYIKGSIDSKKYFRLERWVFGKNKNTKFDIIDISVNGIYIIKSKYFFKTDKYYIEKSDI